MCRLAEEDHAACALSGADRPCGLLLAPSVRLLDELLLRGHELDSQGVTMLNFRFGSSNRLNSSPSLRRLPESLICRVR